MARAYRTLIEAIDDATGTVTLGRFGIDPADPELLEAIRRAEERGVRVEWQPLDPPVLSGEEYESLVREAPSVGTSPPLAFLGFGRRNWCPHCGGEAMLKDPGGRRYLCAECGADHERDVDGHLLIDGTRAGEIDSP